VVAKSELMDLVWPGSAVEENNLSVQIHALRRALGEDRRMIATVAGRGYRFAEELRPGRETQAETSTVPRVTIVVLPFTSLSDDREQQYFADGITVDLTTDLSRLADMTVISRNTAFRYRNRPTETKLIGRELGSATLEGSVQRLGNKVRVSAQLIDAETDTILWANRLESDAHDLFAIQNEITGRIGIALNAELVAAEASRSTDRPGVMDYIFRARALYLGNAPTRSIYAGQIAFYEGALALDPDSRKVQSFLAWQLAARVLDQIAGSADSDIARAEARFKKACSANPEHPLPHAYLASTHALKSDSERAAAELDIARKLCGDDRYSRVARLKAVGPFGAPKISALFEATYLSGLRKAGMPD
jgi:TolB-like protein